MSVKVERDRKVGDELTLSKTERLEYKCKL